MRQSTSTRAKAVSQRKDVTGTRKSEPASIPQFRQHAASKLPKFRSGRAFYITLALGVFFAFAAFRATYLGDDTSYAISTSPFLERRSLTSLPNEPLLGIRDDDDDCRKVNTVPTAEQCAFIQKNCPEDEGGFSNYLNLYYCKLVNYKPVAFIILISWLGLLFSTIGIAASDFFCENLESISVILGLSENVAGVTFVAFGNGSPDVFSTFAAMSADSGTLAVGELFGAAGFITAVVAGSMALIQTFHMSPTDFLRDTGFFAVAAAFSLFFLWDGRLHLWECIAMVGFYIFYVGVVLVMGWWKARRRARKEKELAARGHFATTEEDHESFEPYHDDPNEHEPSRRSSMVRGVSQDDWVALERGSASAHPDDDEEAEEERDRMVMSEVANEMRLNRPTRRSRRTTHTPIRPSLVGALEFQSVLKSLHKSQNYRPIPLHTRRFSEDAAYVLQQADRLSTVSDPASRAGLLTNRSREHSPSPQRPNASTLNVPGGGRMRAVSANDAAGLSIDPDIRRLSQDRGRQQGAQDLGSEDGFAIESVSSLFGGSDGLGARHPLLSVNVEPATPRRDVPAEFTALGEGDPHETRHTVPPRPAFLQVGGHLSPNFDRRADNQPPAPPRSVPQSHNLPQIIIPDGEGLTTSPQTLSPFPQYRDSPSPTLSGGRSENSTRAPSLYLPSPLAPVASPEVFSDYEPAEENPVKPLRWWPYTILPPPMVILHTLFPTIERWNDRSFWGKCIGLSAAPSVFLLTLTLPVVPVDEVTADDGDSDATLTRSPGLWPLSSGGPKDTDRHTPIINGSLGDSSQQNTRAGSHGDTTSSLPQGPRSNTQSGTGDGTPIVRDYAPPPSAPPAPRMPPPHNEAREAPQVWNRWLLIIQLFFAPQFILLAIYVQAPADLSPSWFIKPVLICLLISTILLVILLATTTPTHKPRVYHTILSNVGFVVSVAWISTIASQVVGGLKALAVICNMSHAIMGLTIFAVGNSLGDLVANVTLAQLGRPVMALSACFGGPLLNILLGIGLSGSYLLIRGAERRHEKHPDKHLKFKAYHIEVERTLIISGCTLLLTLIGLMIAVPLNRFKFGRRIGWCLIASWTISTALNVGIEVSGLNK